MLIFDHLGDSQIFTATDRVHNWPYRFRVRRIVGRKATVYLLVCETGRPLSSAMSLAGAECAVRGLLNPVPGDADPHEITDSRKLAKWRNRRCKRCRSEALDYGSAVLFDKATGKEVVRVTTEDDL